MGVQQGRQAAGSAAYLNDMASDLAPESRCAATCDNCWLRADVGAAALRHAAARAVATAAMTLSAATGGKGLVFVGRAWNDNTVDSIGCVIDALSQVPQMPPIALASVFCLSLCGPTLVLVSEHTPTSGILACLSAVRSFPAPDIGIPAPSSLTCSAPVLVILAMGSSSPMRTSPTPRTPTYCLSFTNQPTTAPTGPQRRTAPSCCTRPSCNRLTS